MRSLLVVLALIIAALCGFYLASPWYAAHRLVQAARAGDARALAGAVDFPALRASLKPQLQAYLAEELAQEKARPQSVWDRLKLAVAPYLAGPTTELMITPDTVAAIVRTGRAPHLIGAVDGKPARRADDTGPGDARERGAGYVGDDLDQFRVEVISRSHPAARVKLLMLRRGFFTWKLVGLELRAPQDKAEVPTA